MSARRDAIFALGLWLTRGDRPTQALPPGAESRMIQTSIPDSSRRSQPLPSGRVSHLPPDDRAL